jgi:predicted nucleotidyltransferase
MPVRSSTSSVLRWPDRGSVVAALEAWAAREACRHPGLLRLGYYGSYARGNWGVGSDVDLIAIVEEAADPFEGRALAWDLLDLPVPADLVVYTREEWERLRREGGRFARTIEREAVWLAWPIPSRGQGSA